MNLSKHFKGEKLIIHMSYWIIILVLIIISLITTRSYSNESLAEQVAFGGTLSGIILSVIAIIMTLIGETKSDNTKDKLFNLSEDLEEVVEKIQYTTKNLEDTLKSNLDVKKQINSLSYSMEKIINMPKGNNMESEHYLIVLKKLLNESDGGFKLGTLVVFTYFYFKANGTSKPIEYTTFVTDLSNLDTINLSDNLVLNAFWGMSLVFINPIRNDKNFGEYLENYFRNNYEEEYKEMLKFKGE